MSQNQQITLDTDKVFDRMSDTSVNGKSKSYYVNKAAHVSALKPYSLELIATDPKPNGDSLGVLRPEFRLRLACDVLNAAGETVTKVLAYTLIGSVPVGFPSDVELEARTLLTEFAMTADFVDFVKFGEV